MGVRGWPYPLLRWFPLDHCVLLSKLRLDHFVSRPPTTDSCWKKYKIQQNRAQRPTTEGQGSGKGYGTWRRI